MIECIVVQTLLTLVPLSFSSLQCHWKTCSTGCSKRFQPLDYMCDAINCYNLFHQNCAVQWEVSEDYECDEIFCMFCHPKSADALKDVDALPPKNNNPTHLPIPFPNNLFSGPSPPSTPEPVTRRTSPRRKQTT